MEDKKVKVSANLKLFQWQLDVVSNLEQHWKGYTHVIKSRRQIGKSTLLQLLLIRTAIEQNKTVSICLSPTLSQSRKLFRSVKNILQPTKIYRRHNDLNLVVELKNGSEIYFKSAEQRDALRGFTVTGIYCIDEAAYVNDDVIYDTLPWVNVSQAPVVVVSTPYHKTGFFYTTYMRGFENGTKVLSYDWADPRYDTSALLPPDKLEEYRKSMPIAKFRTEYLGEFLDNEGGVFGDFSGVVSNNYDKDSTNYYFGIDWGSGQGQDETAIAIFNNNREMVKLYHFSDKDETQTINFIISLIKEYQPLKVQVESNSIGQIFYGLLDKAIKSEQLPVMLLRFTTTNESKEKLINNFQVYVQNKQVQILDDPTLIVQLEMYEMKITNNGKRTYNAHQGYHDDCIIATLLAIDCITKGTYNIL